MEICVQEFNWGVASGTYLKESERNKIGQRKKLICDVVTTEVSASPTGSSRVEMVLHSSPKLKQKSQTFFPCKRAVIRHTLWAISCSHS